MEDNNTQDEKQDNADSNPSKESESTENEDNESKTVPYARFKEVNEKKKELEKKVNEKRDETNDETTTNRSSSNSDDYVTKSDLERSRLRDKGYKKETVDFIMNNGGEDALDDPHVAKAVESMKEQNSAEDAADVNASSKSDKSRKVTREEMDNMSSEEMRKALSQ